ncbi:MAG: radical SAM protein [Alistipes sp.]|nr:radical SAM protein [Alistipes sp.]
MIPADINNLTPTLNKLDIFAYQQSDGRIMLYAPVANVVAEMEYEEVLTLEHQAKIGLHSEELVALTQKEVEIYQSQTPDKITELSILINQRCNFSCAYCYSANGRDNREMSLEQLISIIDWFVDKKRGDKLDITFSGGGDPILSFNLVRQGIEYALGKAQRASIELNVGIVTNGSTITSEQMDFISQYNIGLVVSCDIIEEIHNAQRSHYNIVASTIDELCRRNIEFGIRSTITPLNVTRQEEMVEVLHKRFPAVRSAAFEVVLNDSLFATSKDLERFYIDFEEHLFNAQALGDSYGITIGNTIINNVDVCKIRACLGKLVATPYGYLTACSRISSPQEAHYHKFVYGHIDKGGVYANDSVISGILDKNAETYTECHSCIAKYHCSGGCLLARYSLPAEYFKCYCAFMKRMVVHRLKQLIIE